ncbi:MAG: 3-oxoacyl-ACP synthase [Elusimicrobia bacterium RIFCSPLOWO2_02_FULL_39_32]|nr:MAG: 3-oxoacyl-ACP synthase [Elusimicrobia bacterium RIFCSPHIGHO2_02_FULL_39_36]OGR92799.1 MAG: 3-oxoacyl-ACP synthase [Elusimicrobia bacterium RIFCSPLOWO2_02_FULL_39_32]OGR99583.1 MAG: 3-oxoacyl-ACP synthase [Elusimicrobia bacterium RIFCSPLOWO2_12_FULL_39_28]
MLPKKRARIIGTGKCMPKTVLTNQDLEKMVNTTDEWIKSRTGIKERRITTAKESTSDLAIQAAKDALENAHTKAEELDAILVCTCTPDMFFPSVGCILQAALGAKKAWAMDLSAACSGFIYGMATAKSFIESGAAQKILLIGVDTLSKITNWQDRSTCILFGDGAGACVLSSETGESGILSVFLGADGSNTEILKVPAGGSRMPIDQNALNEKLNTIKMDGPEVYKLAVTKMVEAAKAALRLADKKPTDLKLIIPHQANLRIIESVAKRLELKEDVVFVNVQKYGNMSAATTIVALDEAQKEGRIKQGELLELVAFGAGLTWGAAVIQW